MSKVKKRTIGDLFIHQCHKVPDSPAIGWLVKDKVKSLTFDEYRRRVEAICLGLKTQGLKRKDNVCIFAKTRPEWNLLDLAIMSMGSVVVPVYHDSSVEDLAYIVEHSEAQKIVIDTPVRFKRLLDVIHKLPNLKQVIAIEDIEGELARSLPSHIHFMQLRTLYSKGLEEVKEHPDLFQRLTNDTFETDVATIIYTSGTTGLPKGAVITQEAMGQMLLNVKKFTHGKIGEEDRSFIFLPLAHVFGRCDSLLPIIFGNEAVYASKLETLLSDIKIVEPTFMLAVPRVFEKIYLEIKKELRGRFKFKKELFNKALKAAKEYYDDVENDRTPSLGTILKYQIAYMGIFNIIYQKFGGKIRYFISGGATLNPKVFDLMKYSKLFILEGYGLTETIAPCTLNPLRKQIKGTVGIPIGDVQIKFDVDGEVLIKSRALFSAYYQDEEATGQAFDEGGWFRTGDLGRFDENGYLIITGRKKDLIILSTGKNISPSAIETKVKSSSDLIDHIILYGEGKKFLSALIIPNKEKTFDLAKSFGLETDSSTLSELLGLSQIKAEFDGIIRSCNLDLSSFTQIKKFTFFDQDVTSRNYMTSSMKLKKDAILGQAREQLEEFYFQ